MEVDNERDGAVERATYKQREITKKKFKQRNSAPKTEKGITVRQSDGRVGWGYGGVEGEKRGKHQM